MRWTEHQRDLFRLVARPFEAAAYYDGLFHGRYRSDCPAKYATDRERRAYAIGLEDDQAERDAEAASLADWLASAAVE